MEARWQGDRMRGTGTSRDGLWARAHQGTACLPIIHHPSSIIHRRAFTLIELLMVISITVMLAALLLPSVQRARKQAQAVACQAKLRQWSLLFSMQQTANQGEAVTPFAYEKNESDLSLKGLSWWPPLKRRYGPQMNELFLCPAARRLNHTSTQIYDDGWTESSGDSSSAWWFIPPRGETMVGSYGFSMAVGGPDHLDRKLPPWAVRVNTRTAAIIPVMFDCGDWVASGRDDGPPPRSDDLPWYESRVTGWSNLCMDRHIGTVIYVFLDWSVRRVGLKGLWTLKWTPDFDTHGPWTKAGGVKPEDWPKWMRNFKDY